MLRGLSLAFSSFSKIPMPQVEWREENMRYLMCFFPVVGLAVGAAVAAWTWAAAAAAFGQVLFGVGVALVPLAVTGGIHLDGFCDVVDAQSSHASPERKREILKDPHTGSFAAIGVAAYLLAYAAVASELQPTALVALLLCCMHVASRCMSGIATVSFPTSSSAGMLSMFHESAHGRRVLAVLIAELVACTACMTIACLPAFAIVAVGLACLAGLYPFALRQFGGMSGDIAGFFLQIAELAMVCALVALSKAVGL